MALYFIGFAIIATILFFEGKRLSHYGDLLANKTGMGHAWTGLVLMSAVTSLPELMVGISSSAIVVSADLAVGDILGSCAFNLGILSLMDVFTPKNQPLFTRVSQSHIMAACFGIILVVMAGLGLFLNDDVVLTPSIGLTSLSFAVMYFWAMKTIYKFQKQNVNKQEPEHHQESGLTLRQVVVRYALFALIIVAAALTLPFFAEHIAEATGLGKSFVEILFLAATTSPPEIAVSLAALRMGALDMAIGNLLGSNIFNIFILFLDDIFYTSGHILKDASEANLVTVFFVVLMTAVAIMGLVFPSREKKIFMAWDTFTIFSLYILNMFLLCKLS